MVLFLIVLFILLPRKHFFFLGVVVISIFSSALHDETCTQGLQIVLWIFKATYSRNHVFPSLVRYLLREHFTFNPIKDPTIRPLFGQDGVRCWRCGGQTRLEYHDRFGPRLVHGMARDFYVMGVSLECLNKFGCKKPVFLSECQIY